MRLNNVFSGRPAYYDRTPTTIVNSANTVAAAPHGGVNRWTYTVPTARKFQIGNLYVLCVRATVAGTGALFGASIISTPSGGAAATILDTQSMSNAIDGGKHIASGNSSVLKAGDNLVGNDFDNSTTGTITFEEGMEGTEFDA